MKKKFSMLLSVLLTFGCTNFAFASNIETLIEKEFVFTESVNEFEKFKTFQTYTVDELVDIGLTKDEATKIKATTFEELVLERARLPESILENMGYSDKDIEVLKAYNGEELTADSEVVARATAKCTGSLRPISATGSGTDRKITFRYAWLWDKSPIVTASDSAAVTWFAYNDEGDLKKSSVASKSGNITYVDYTTGAKTTQSLTTNTQTGDAASKVLVGSNYAVRIDHSSNGGKWAKEGELRIQVGTGGMNYVLHTLDVVGKVGHCTLSSNSISVTLVPTTSLADIISFTPRSITEEVGYANYEIPFNF